MKEITEQERESIQIWDERDLKWKLAYETRFRRLETVEFFKDKTFTTTGEKYYSKSFECAPYREFMLFIKADCGDASSYLDFGVELSHDNVNFFDLQDSFFDSFPVGPGANVLARAESGWCRAHWVRIRVIAYYLAPGDTGITSGWMELTA